MAIDLLNREWRTVSWWNYAHIRTLSAAPPGLVVGSAYSSRTHTLASTRSKRPNGAWLRGQWIANLSVKIQPEPRAQKKYKNEGWSQYVIENKCQIKRQNVICQYIPETNRFIRNRYMLLKIS